MNTLIQKTLMPWFLARYVPLFILFFITGCLFLPQPAFALTIPAKPLRAMFYPNEVQLFVEETTKPAALPGGGQGFLLTLPASADELSFMASVDGTPLYNFTFLHPPAAVVPYNTKALIANDEPHPERKKILQDIEATKATLYSINSNIAQLHERWKIWTESTDKAPYSVAEKANYETHQNQRLPEIASTNVSLTEQLALVQNKLNGLQNSLTDFDQKNTTVEVAVRLHPQEAAALQQKSTVKITYSYTMSGGYQPAYRLTALPTKKNLRIEQFAVLRQESGIVWENVDVSLSTYNRMSSLHPFPLNPWIMQQNKSSSMFKGKANAEISYTAAQRTQEDAIMPALTMGGAPQPVETEGNIARTWQLGGQTLTSHENNRILLANKVHNANFVYTLRPKNGQKSFLTANVLAEAPLELASGLAQFVVDDTIVGNQPFAFYGDKGAIYFGEDPQVTATMVNQKSQTGTSGFINKNQTYLWDWVITLKNNKDRPVVAYVVDSTPVSKDESITVSFSSTPPALAESGDMNNQQQQFLTWEIFLEAGQEKVIKHKVELKAAQDMDISKGREL